VTRLASHGIAIDVLPGWEGRIFVPDLAPPAINLPILHLTDVVLTQERSSYAPELAARAGGSGTLVALLEFDHALANVGLYERKGLHLPLTRERFHHRALQFPSRVQEGHQRFFSEGGRAFCLYVVLGTGRGVDTRLAQVNRALASLHIRPRKVAM
jgi:hypothetical protein